MVDKNVFFFYIVNNVVIEKVFNYVFMYGYNGIMVLWDGIDVVYVYVLVNYKNKICGLCGNYNGLLDDDIRMLGY